MLKHHFWCMVNAMKALAPRVSRDLNDHQADIDIPKQVLIVQQIGYLADLILRLSQQRNLSQHCYLSQQSYITQLRFKGPLLSEHSVS